MNMKKILIFIGCIIFTSNIISQTQKASLIFLDGDVLEGYGVITKDNKIKFRISLDEKPDVWDNLIVRGIIFYGFEKEEEYEYIYTKIKKEPELLRVVLKGKITLYERKRFFKVYRLNNLNGEDFGNSFLGVRENIDLFIKRDNEEIATLYNRTMKRSIQNYFKDCDAIFDLIESNEYRKYSREKLVKNYNIFCGD